ncbi:MSEP-CTERM sorting domain-containing protein [Mangrovivirga sp. M17]|uniref:MSEP-CTERM sorting domain-containing protein n=1 Tax=Mangrovivirga halotolerans TaxID=2993936 RepID=A0ABT3RPD2_9BACT|nr:MSEP-CTERM sorting domain-containing protein [Mangrovivirga halotolerans]MCX2743654.1 MSEP-CTERM sorting domain-containing protein [Mangrovivirga halotolerans]
MKKLLETKWIILSNTVPVIILLLLLNWDYQVFKSSLSEDSIEIWQWTWGIIIGYGIINLELGFSIHKINRGLQALLSIINMLLGIGIIFFAFYFANKIHPWSIPQWMTNNYLVLYFPTFIMPTIAYSIYALILFFTPNPEDKKAWKSFLIALAVPLICYLFVTFIIPALKNSFDDIHQYSYTLIASIAPVIFLFFLLQGFYIVIKNKSGFWQKYQLPIKIVFTLVLPIAGLITNFVITNEGFETRRPGIFGDFHHFWFYALTIINGAVLCINNPEGSIKRLALFLLRCVTFSFTLYFFLVFLPYMPLSILGIILIGLGFLTLTPIILMLLHSMTLKEDWNYLKNYFSRLRLSLYAVGSFLVIPIMVTLYFSFQRSNLMNALDYVYNPDFTESKASVWNGPLESTLTKIYQAKSNRNQLFMGYNRPYLSSYYDWLVLDNLVLSDSKIKRLNKVFFNEKTDLPQRRQPMLRPENPNVNIEKVKVDSKYDRQTKTWTSTVDLDISNSLNAGMQEYSTTFTLPDGCWISDYYLDIEGRREKGILAEKKSAFWVYTNIVNVRRDPGILYYEQGNDVSFRVFPFEGKQTRTTGMEFIHRSPVEIIIDGQKIKLGSEQVITQPVSYGSDEDNIRIVSAKEKQGLKRINREPYLHLIVDHSANSADLELAKIIKQITAQNPEWAAHSKLSLVNSSIETIDLTDSFQGSLGLLDKEGGFMLERALKKLLFDSYHNPTDRIPVFYVITDDFDNAIIENNSLSDWKFTYPGNDLFYVTNGKSTSTHNLWEGLTIPTDESNEGFYTRKLKLPTGEIRYLRDDNKDEFVLLDPYFDIDEDDLEGKTIESALLIEGLRRSEILYPEEAADNWGNLVRASFQTGIMTPVTSYIALENEAQKAALLRKQKQVLSGKKGLDAGEEPDQMSEPTWWFVGAMMILLMWYRRKRLAVKN